MRKQPERNARAKIKNLVAVALLVCVTCYHYCPTKANVQEMEPKKMPEVPAYSGHAKGAETERITDGAIQTMQKDSGSSLESGATRWRDELFSRLDVIRSQCGDLCSVNSLSELEKHTVDEGPYFRNIRADVKCDVILNSVEMDAADTTVPFPMLTELKPYYSMNGLVTLRDYKRYVNVYLGKNQKDSVWSEEYLSRLILKMDQFLERKYFGWPKYLFETLKNHGDLAGKRALVLGSETPWVEAICLMLGAKTVVTLEYGFINSTHPQLQPMRPFEFQQKYRDGTLGKFDIVVTFSSVEHPGLGRYGDALNPWADILAIARVWCVTKSDGLLAVGVPTGKDAIIFNGHRIYGKYRYPLLAANWRQLPIETYHSELETYVDDDLKPAVFNGSTIDIRQPVYLFQKVG